jgi:uncharacterized protein YjiS (DUF1127 family)
LSSIFQFDHVSRLCDRIAAHFANVLARIRDGGEMRPRYETLSRMSTTDLAKRGLTRAEIMRVVLGAER